MTLYRQSNIAEDLSRALLINNGANDVQYYIYGDSAYVLRAYLQVRFKGGALSDEQKAFNKLMSRCRIAGEWAFKYIKKYFTHVDVPRTLCISNTPAALWYYCAAILWNFRACLYGSESATFFDCQAPALEDYVSLLDMND